MKVLIFIAKKSKTISLLIVKVCMLEIELFTKDLKA